ncbi:hypothetical protein EON66_11445 [archaeon]|nr:MAG: hypothetical protein EON66_11445 [archaeon]
MAAARLTAGVQVRREIANLKRFNHPHIIRLYVPTRSIARAHRAPYAHASAHTSAHTWLRLFVGVGGK